MPEAKSLFLRGAGAALAFIFLAGISADLSAEVTSAQAVDVPEQRLSAALQALARQTNVNILVDPELIKGRVSPAVRAHLSVSDALNLMLKGTGLAPRYVDEKTITLVSVNSEQTAAGLPTAGAQSSRINMVRTGAGTTSEQPMANWRIASVDATSSTMAVDENQKTSESEPATTEIVVTGTLLRSAHPTSPVISITREEIDRMGAYSVEDILRRLPQNFSSLNRASSRNNGLPGESSGVFIPDTLGNSGIDLRGLGLGTTLVLIDGRRTASSPISENGFVNLSTIPAASIERIDVILDGASSIYGSDAIGGVVNIITRRDYRGAETNLRYENSNNDADQYVISQLLGTGWEGGRITAVLSYDENKAVNTLKTGHTTQDQRSRGGRDFRSTSAYTSPGSVFIDPYGSQPLGALPAGSAGTSVSLANLTLENARLASNEVFRLNERAPTTKSSSATVNFDQKLGEKFSVFGRLLYSQAKNSASDNPFQRLYIPASNAYNNIDFNNDGVTDPVWVNYAYIGEVQSGMLRKTSTDYTQERTDVMLGFSTALPIKDWQLEMEGQFGKESSDGEDLRYQQGQWMRNAADTAYVDVAGNPLPSSAPISQRALTPFGQLVASGDPATALNPFGDGSAQGDLSVMQLTPFISGRPVTEQTTFRFKTDGALWAMSGGEVRAAIGGEYRKDVRDYSQSSRRVINPDYAQDDNVGESSIVKPEQSVSSVFTELYFPLVGSHNARRGIQSLRLVVSGRYDDYDVPDANDGDGASYSRVSPKVGFTWSPIRGTTFRANWSEAFRAPSFNDLVSAPVQYDLTNCGFYCTTIVDPLNGDVYLVPRNFGGNPDLKPEIAEIITVGVDWSPAIVKGLLLSLNYNNTDYRDRIASLSYFDEDFDLTSPVLAPRDAGGRIERLVESPVNLSQSISETLDFAVRYEFMTSRGAFSTSVGGTHVLDRSDRLFETSPVRERVATENGPDTWDLTGSLGWQRNNYGLDLFVYYGSRWQRINTGGEYVFTPAFAFIPNPPQAVGSYTTVDLTGNYKLEKSGWSFQMGIRNLFDSSAPFVDDYTPYDLSRVDTRGRVAYLNVRKSFAF